MSQRTRYILIIIILLVVIGAGAGAIYYFNSRGQGAATGAGLRQTDSGTTIIDRMALSGGASAFGSDITWLSGCTTSFDPSAQSSWSGQVGQNFQIAFECQNTAPEVAHTLEAWTYDAPAYVFEVTGEPCRDDATKSAQAAGTSWPPAITFPDYNAMVTWMSQFWTQGSNPQRNKTCADLPPANTNIQQLDFNNPTRKQTFQVPVGAQAVSFTVAHEFPSCDWYQYDDILHDPVENSAEAIMGAARHVSGQIGATGCAGAPAVGNLEVRMYEDVDGNKEYSTPTAGGTDAPFAGQTVTIRDAAGGVAPCGVTTGGAGRISCFQIPVGQYTVEVNNPNAVVYQGPLVDATANPQPGEKHNATGSQQLTLTVVPGAQPQGTGNDVVTYYDFGYNKKIITSAVGNLEVRIYEDVDKNGEYSTPAAGGTDAPFAFQTVAVTNAAGEDIIAKGLCDTAQGTKTGGAGRFDCWQIPTGKYTVVTTNPDPTKYKGPIVDATANPAPGEQHNAGGTVSLTLTVVPGPVPDGIDFSTMAFYDFGYNKKLAGPIVAGSAQPCVVDKTVTDGSASNEESPDDTKKSVSSTGETLNFSIAYNCKGTGTATTVPTGTTIVITDAYDETLTTPSDSTISDAGSHDTAQHTISWTLQAGASLTGTVTFSSVIKSGLAAGTYTSLNDVSITRDGNVDDQDQTVTTITVTTSTNTPNNTPRPTPGNSSNTPTGNRPTTPTTGVGANVAIILISLLAAAAITAFAMLRLKPSYRRN